MIGIIGAVRITHVLGHSTLLLRIILFIVFFILIVAAIRLLGWLMTKAINIFPLSFFNRLLGGFLGLVKAGIVFWILIFLYLSFIPKASSNLARSPLSFTLWKAGTYLIKIFPSDWQRIFKLQPGEKKKPPPQKKLIDSTEFRRVI